MLKISNITKKFGSLPVLKGINIEVRTGEFLTLLGPSGCGKTTLLRIISGLEKADGGRIVFDDKDISEIPTRKRNFSLMFQSYALFPNLNVEENISFGLKSRKLPKSEINKRVHEAIEMIKLSETKKMYPSQLSGGMQQRVALARALVLKPKILLLDEPLSALDAKVREELRRQIHLIQRELNITTIMVTHDQEEALTMSDTVALLNCGKLEQVADPVTLYQNPASPFVADFIGTINFYPADLISHQSGIGAIRPEHISLSKNRTSDNQIKAKIELVEFYGTSTKAYCRLEKEKILFIVDLSAETAQFQNVVMGNICYLDIRVEMARYFKGEYNDSLSRKN